MRLIDTTNGELPHFVRAHAKVLAMVTRAESGACERLLPVFTLFATNPAYAGIKFLQLPAPETPRLPAGQWLAAPFFLAYAQGQLLYGDTLSTEQQVRGVLHALHAHA